MNDLPDDMEHARKIMTDDTRIPPKGGSSTAGQSRLYQLPDGNWILPKLIQAVFAYPKATSYAGYVVDPNRVVLAIDGDTHMIAYDTFDNAVLARDKIAADLKQLAE